jgi:cyclic pyranopterin phosphate synthase
MPCDTYSWIHRTALLTFEEITRLAGLFTRLGVQKIRLTGGEPLVRQNLEMLISGLSRLEEIEDISLTTNGSLLAEQAVRLRDAGLRRINVSLDTLKPERFRELTQRGDLAQVLAGIDAARRAGFERIKINAVVIRGVNEDEILDLVEYGRSNGCQIRFIEFMDVGNANDWSMERTVSKEEILTAVESRYPIRKVGRDGDRAPATDYRFLDGRGYVGVIGSVTEPFCSTCTRARLTADGKLVTCLFAEQGFDLRELLRSGATDAGILDAISQVWGARMDRYSDDRWEAIQSGSRFERKGKIEMITLGG